MARDQWSVAPNPQWSMVFVSKKEKEMEAKSQGEGRKIHGSGHGGLGGSVKDRQFMG